MPEFLATRTPVHDGVVDQWPEGALPALMAAIFPPRTRVTGLSLSYNISVPIFGGFAPLVATALIALTGDSLAPSYYLMLTALLSLISLILLRRHFAVR